METRATIVYLSTLQLATQLMEDLARVPHYRLKRETPHRYLLTYTRPSNVVEAPTTYRLVIAETPADVLDIPREDRIDIVAIDTRSYRLEHDAASRRSAFASVLAVLTDPVNGLRFRHHTILAVMDCRGDLISKVYRVGQYRLGGLVIDPASPDAFILAIERILRKRPTKLKTAICFAGGGVEGLLWELGVLRALNSFFENLKVTDFDMYFGISAGACVASVLANGVQPEELIAAFECQSDILEPLTSKVIYDLNYREFLARGISLLTRLIMIKKTYGRVVASVLKSVPSGICRGDRLEAYMSRQFARIGVADDFHHLEKELYIGATDQDTAEHVVFGEEGHRDLKLSEAVHASSALVPFYAAKKINNRYYVDGGYSRTSNFQLAIEKGAKFIIIIDPLVPLSINESGYVNSRGGLFGSIQGIKGMSHTRFVEVFDHVVKEHPEITFLLFRPQARDMKIMSGSPMKYRIRKETQKLGYENAVNKIQQEYYYLRDALEPYGVCFNETRMRTESQELVLADSDAINRIMVRSYPDDPILTDAKHWIKEFETHLWQLERQTSLTKS